MSATVVDAAQEVVDMTADPHQAHTATRGTTVDTTRGPITEWELDRLHQSTMAMDLHHRDIMEDRSWRSSRGRRRLLHRRQEMRMTAKRYGDCLALSTKTVCCSKTHVHTMLTHATESGELTEAELRTALVNGDWTPFDPHTVRMMIRMFDTNRSGSVNFDEFWYLASSLP